GWIATLAVHRARRVIRKRMLRRRFFPPAAEEVAPPISQAASPLERFLLVRCYEVLETLSANQRLAWTLRHIEGETLPEVARLCECSLATAKRWIHKANVRVQAEVGTS
ncbi:MAG: sigma-70 family RNA polymerase sigma factor, partial [Kofleriaceae bacterium]|nr:sigma-70 family RNA polymerase sigma factor [Kofleriaceae bacterium]